MDAIFGSKDVIFAFFGVFLSVVFSQGLFRKTVSFVNELSFSVIPFGYRFDDDKNTKFSKVQTAKLNRFQVERAKKMQRLDKSIACNASVAMTLLIVASSVTSFKFIGANIDNVDVTWGMLLASLFVYLTYFIWSRVRDDGFWESMPAMTASRYNILLTIAGTALVLYLVLLARDAFNVWIFYLLMIPFIYFSIRLNRVPHINLTHRRALDFEEDVNFYLHDIGRETVMVLAVFLVLTITHFMAFDWIRTTAFSEYLNVHPVRSFLFLFSIPFVVFIGQFIHVVGYEALVRLLFHVGRKVI